MYFKPLIPVKTKLTLVYMYLRGVRFRCSMIEFDAYFMECRWRQAYVLVLTLNLIQLPSNRVQERFCRESVKI